MARTSKVTNRQLMDVYNILSQLHHKRRVTATQVKNLVKTEFNYDMDISTIRGRFIEMGHPLGGIGYGKITGKLNKALSKKYKDLTETDIDKLTNFCKMYCDNVEKSGQPIETAISELYYILDLSLHTLKTNYIKSSVMIDILYLIGVDKLKSSIPLLRKIATMDEKNLIGVFKKALTFKEESSRLAAISALIKLKDPDSKANFIEALTDESTNVRLYALDGLNLFTDPNMIPKILDNINDIDPRIVMRTIEVASKYKTSEVSNALISKLTLTTSRPIIICIIEAFTRIKDNSLSQYVKPFLDDNSPDIKLAAERYFKSLEKSP